MNKREFLKALFAGGAGLLLNPSPLLGQQASPCSPPAIRWFNGIRLPPVQINTFSTEIVQNSRYSVHGGYGGALPQQVVANIAWAASRAPVIGSFRKIYVALPDGVYLYDEKRHGLVLHKAGNHLSESSLALEIGVTGELEEDAGACLHYAQLAAVSFWATPSDQPCCCVKDSGRSNANRNWNPDSDVHMVCCFGRASSVAGVTSQLVATSTNGSLPDPATDGPVLLEDALANIDEGSLFGPAEPSLSEIGQIAWGSYGNTPHTAIGRGALTVASAVAYYYMTGRIYIVRSAGVERYHIRNQSGSTASRDHRLERVVSGDRRPNLRTASSKLPPSAPTYFVYCATGSSNWQLVEAGFCGSGAMLQASAIGLRGHVAADFSSQEKSAIISALSIPSDHYPLMVYSTGYGR